MYYDENSFLNKLERKIGWLAIPNLALILVVAMGAVWLADFVLVRLEVIPLSYYLQFNRTLVLRGEVWRVLTFIFVPENDGTLFVFLTLYFFWFMGSTLEAEWGAFRFTIYYLMGYLGSLASGFIMGFTTNYYLNLSLFLAFAILNSEVKVLLFFFFPIKVKWLALLDFVIILIDLILGSWITRVAILFALLNVILFFWKPLYNLIANYFRRKSFERRVEQGYKEAEKLRREQEKQNAERVDADVKDIPPDDGDDLFGF